MAIQNKPRKPAKETAFTKRLFEYMDLHQMSQAKLARKSSYDPSLISRLLSGERTPTNRNFVRVLAKSLDLSHDETDVLLDAAGFKPLNPIEERVDRDIADQMSAALQGQIVSLRANDRTAIEALLRRDWADVLAAWQGYFEGRQSLYRRHWSQVTARRSDQAIQVQQNEVDGRGISSEMPFDAPYRALRRVAARYRAYSLLLVAAAYHHSGDLAAAETAARDALQAAVAADDHMAQARTLLRRGDIAKTRGAFDEANLLYRATTRALGKLHTDPLLRTSAVIWRARLIRKWGTLAFFKGDPEKAQRFLARCVHHLEELSTQNLETDYERLNALLALGQAQNHLGKWAQAVHTHMQALTLMGERHPGDEEADPLETIEVYLCLASDYLTLGTYAAAQRHLDKAREMFRAFTGADPLAAPPEEQAREHTYRELGRYYLLAGRLAWRSNHTAEGIATGRRLLEWGLQFHHAVSVPDPPRLASLYHALALLELAEERRLAASSPIWPNDARAAARRADVAAHQALVWAEASTPANQHYRALALVALYMTATLLDESPAAWDSAEAAARSACERTRISSRPLADLEMAMAQHAARRAIYPAAVEHAAGAVAHAATYHPTLKARMLSQVQEMFQKTVPVGEQAVVLASFDRTLCEIATPRHNSNGLPGQTVHTG